MNSLNRIEQIERRLEALPPDGDALLREMEKMPPERLREWLETRSDMELQVMVECDLGDGVDVRLMTDEQLEQIASGADCELHP